LTTVRVDAEGMGEQAMRLVVESPEPPAAGDRSDAEVASDAARADERTTIQSPTELIVRGSTGPARS